MEARKIEIRDYEKKRKRQRAAIFALLLGVLVFLFFLSMVSGSFRVSISDVWKVLVGGFSESETEYLIVMTLRLPRTLVAIAGGASLAVSGLLLQILFGNPIVESYVLGISTGSSLFVGLTILLGVRLGATVVTPFYLFAGAFVGAMTVLLLILFVASRVKTVVTLLIIGLMCGYVCNAVISIMVSYAAKENIAAFVSWGMGSFSGIGPEYVGILYLIVVPACVVAALMVKPMNALQLGERYALSMGISVKTVRYALILVSGVLTAAITAFAGPVSFIGLAVPHLSRLMFRTSDLKILIPACILNGSVTALFCDFLARTLVAPRELPLSAITAMVGAPVVVYLLRKREKNVHVS